MSYDNTKTLCILSLLSILKTGLYLHLRGEFENNSCSGTDVAALFLTTLYSIHGKLLCNEDLNKLPDAPSAYSNDLLLIFKCFQPSHNTLLHSKIHTSWYLSMINILHWCEIIHGCFCLHPFKVLVFFICTHVLTVG